MSRVVVTVAEHVDRPAACAWCGRALDRDAERLPGRLRCRACGAATTDPWPSDAELEHAYGAWYRPAGGRFAGVGDAVLRRMRAGLARRLDALAPPGAVLDVGAGDGSLVAALRARGRPALGLERAPVRPGVRPGDVTALDEPFAAVVFWHSLEHLRVPGAALDHAAGLLVDGGLIVVSMPNAASLQARAFGRRWFALDLPRHLVHLPAEALIARLQACGLRIERVSHWRGGQVVFGWLHGLVGTLPGRPDLYDAIRRAPARRVPMGRGARAATLAAAVALLPGAAALAGIEALLGRGGTVYVEARRHYHRGP